MSDNESDAPEEVTAQQGFQQFEEIIQAQKESKARIVREGKERRRKWAENLTPRQRSRKDESVVDVVESQPNNEVQDKKGMLPDDIVKLIAAQEKEKKVFSSDSEEEEESLKKLKSKKKKQKKSGDGPIILKEIPPSQCLQNSLEFINKRRMQVPRSSAVLKNLKKAPRLVSSKGLLSRK